MNGIKALLLPAIVILIVAAAAAVREVSFGSAFLLSVAQQSVQPILVTMGIALIMQCGRWDFAGGAEVILIANIVGQAALHVPMEAPWFILLCIAVGILLSLVYAKLYFTLRVPGVVSSLGLMLIFEAAASMLTDGAGTKLIGSKSAHLLDISRSPSIFFFLAGAVLLFYVIYDKTALGYGIRAMGAPGNGQKIARDHGLDTKRTTLLSFLGSGVFFALAAVVSITMTGSRRAALNAESLNLLFDGMIGVIIAARLEKYCNFALAILIGGASLRLLYAGLLIVGINADYQYIIKGAFLIVFLLLTSGILSPARWMRRQRRAAENGEGTSSI